MHTIQVSIVFFRARCKRIAFGVFLTQAHLSELSILLFSYGLVILSTLLLLEIFRIVVQFLLYGSSQGNFIFEVVFDISFVLNRSFASIILKILVISFNVICGNYRFRLLLFASYHLFCQLIFIVTLISQIIHLGLLLFIIIILFLILLQVVLGRIMHIIVCMVRLNLLLLI